MKGFIESLWMRLQEIFDPKNIGAELAQGLAKLILALAVFIAFYLVWLLLRLFVRPALRRWHMDETTISFVETILKYGIIMLGAIKGLDAAGIKTSAIIASLGIAGLTIGFAARDALSNLISGILIFLDRPFVIGDLIEIEGNYGKVEKITLRSTRVVTKDGKMLAVPNTEVINKTVASYTNFPHLRLDVAVTIAVTEDIDRARQILLSLVKEDPDFLKAPAPRVVVTELNDYNVAVELQVWLDNERQHVEKRYGLREKVFNALNKAGINMPFETIEITPLNVKITQEGGSSALPERTGSGGMGSK
ncbi:MAG: mechanosensitive ion channel protein MscS [Nitrospira bacterium SG8_3]|nr:MAG: mechanosensitive ion channel protein MscS [Nitrospira bacterium SG8_3]